MRPLLTALLFALTLGAAPPQRIVSTAPSLTEMLYALGLGDRVVGVTEYCRYPPDAISKPKVGSFLQPDFERILAARPDLVLVVKNPVQIEQKLNGLKLNAATIPQDTVEEVLVSAKTIGALTGKQQEGAQLEVRLRKELDAVRAASKGSTPVSVLFLVGRSPGTLQGMVGAGRGTFIDELITMAGGRNVLSDSPIQYPKVSLETVLEKNPDVILDMGDFAHVEGRPGQPESEVFALWAKYPQLKSVRGRKVYVIGSEEFIRPGPRMTQAARQFLKYLHPEVAR